MVLAGVCWKVEGRLGRKTVAVDRSFYRRRGTIKVLLQIGFSLDEEDVSLED